MCRVMIQDAPMQYLYSSARRLYRIFIHAYEHHNEMFRAFEVFPSCKWIWVDKNRMKLGCILFFLHLQNGKLSLFGVVVNVRYGLVPRELITIPSDYKDVIEGQDEYSRPTESGTLYEVDHTLTNGEID